MELITPTEARALCAQYFAGQSATLPDRDGPSLDNIVRSAAAVACPCSRNSLVYVVCEANRGIWEQFDKELVSASLDQLLGNGDLLEIPSPNEGGTYIDLTPPSFVWRQSGEAIIVGGLPDNYPFLTADLIRRLDTRNGIRVLRESDQGEDLCRSLLALGMNQIDVAHWTMLPQPAGSAELIAKYVETLLPVNGQIEGVKLLKQGFQRYYKDRVEPLESQTGYFVARKPQKYGADSWCFIETIRGQLRGLLEFPTTVGGIRGCDEAWYLLAALDYEAGEPQRFDVRDESEQALVLSFFGPIPAWAERRLSTFGERTESNTLFSFRLAREDFDEEVEFLAERLWMLPD